MIHRPPANLNSLWADLMVEQLCRSGVRSFVLSPGSRSTPLVAAVGHRADVDSVVHYDERGAGFYALGRARATGKPVAVITTSGTAVANLFPAVVEASQSGIPLVLLTADRPPELRGTGANQTIDQVEFFGDYVRWQVDLSCPTETIGPDMPLSAVSQALDMAERAPKGPVHLNCMYREPLAPLTDGVDYASYLSRLESWLQCDQPYGADVFANSDGPPNCGDEVLATVNGATRGVLLVGKLDGREAAAVEQLGARLGWPMLPDVCSGLRLGAAPSCRIHNYDLLLRSDSFAEKCRPDVVLHMGGAVTSKRALEILAAAPPPAYIQVKADPRRCDPLGLATQDIECDVAAFSARLTDSAPKSSSSEWLSAWLGSSRAGEAAIARALDDVGELDEPSAARLISQQLPGGSGLVLANSMPVRDMDMYASPEGLRVTVLANRGASGIDGTVATAAGFAAARKTPVTLLMGDLALLHDLNSLPLLAQCGQPIALVVINNDGGGIFSFLPVAQCEPMFEKYFGAPHGFSFDRVAGMFGLAYSISRTRAEFATQYEQAMTGPGATLLELKTDRQANLARHRELEALVVQALAQA